jgi:hypothetical protein
MATKELIAAELKGVLPHIPPELHNITADYARSGCTCALSPLCSAHHCDRYADRL